MTLSKDEMHVYLRHIDESERTSLSVLVAQIAPGSTVLDVGCGSGALGEYLHSKRQCTVDGVTFNEAEAELARASYRKVEVADLERTPLTDLFGDSRYDRIVCADILEHLRQPEALLGAMAQLLAPGGQLLISIPNSTYAGLLAELIEGEFLYREEGLLDATHVRHVTRKSLMRMLERTGWQVQQLETIERATQESEFKTPFDRLPPAVARHLLATADALTYQFIVTAEPVAVGDSADNQRFLAQHEIVPGQEPQAQALFSAQLYWDEGQGMSEERKIVQAGVIGQERQTLRFALPAPDTLAALRTLKFDPADRPGILYLHGLRLSVQGQENAPLWQWQCDDADAASLLQTATQHDIAWGHALLGRSNAAGGLPAILTGHDPWFTLPIAEDDLADMARNPMQGPLVLEVELGWPMSADYLSLVALAGPLQAEQQHLRERNAEQQRLINHLSESHETLAGEHTQLHQHHAETARHLERIQDDNRRLFAERERAMAEIANLHQQLRGMDEHLENMRNLRVIRYTRPLVKLRDALKGGAATADMKKNTNAKNAINATNARNALDAPASTLPVTTPAGARSQPASDTVDIIVPVYRGLADTQLCVQSVLASEVATPYRLIVINDCSPEPEVTAWLREAAAADARITLLENTENHGFVGTVNRGMRESTHNDVLLLNSDTEVANDWLDRLRAAAWRPTAEGATAGTVTPFSSNATICSYPDFCRDNPLPEGHTTASIDRLFAQANPGQSVDVPTGVGFCMYIRRDCLDAVGLFDEEHFGKGYGEENDFCQRALRQGWRSLHALDTYVLHTGGVSFGESKSPREQAAMETLRRLHPDYEQQVQGFVRRDPARAARLAVDWLRATDGGRKSVVLAVQHQRGGGTERHVLELAEHLADAVAFVSLKPAGTHHVVLQLVAREPKAGADNNANDAGEPAMAWCFSQNWQARFDLNDEQDTLLQVLKAMGVAHVHYHHLLGHHRLIWELPALLGVGYDFTSHDFYSHCTHITLTGSDNRYQVDAQGECCGGTHPPSMPALVENIDTWRIRNRLFLQQARFVLAPSLDTASRMRQHFPTAQIRCAPHTDIDPAALGVPQPRALAAGQPLRIAVIGALSIIKGADILEETARLARKAGLPLEFHLIGYGYRHLQTAPATALKVHGQYREEALPGLLQRIAPDLVWFPALWPETYSYTLSAALQANLPVVVPDLGAFAERVANRPWSWVHPWDASAQQWLELFAAIHSQWSQPGFPSDAAAQTAPPLSEALQALQNTLEPWDYLRDYPVAAVPDTTAHAHTLGQHIAAAQLLHPVQPPGGGLYGLALRLQRSRMLGPIMRRVPQSWRYRIKHILSR